MRKQMNKLYRLGDIISGIVKNIPQLNDYNVNRLFVYDKSLLTTLNNNLDEDNNYIINLITKDIKNQNGTIYYRPPVMDTTVYHIFKDKSSEIEL